MLSSRTRNQLQGLQGGKFAKKCGCLIHNETSIAGRSLYDTRHLQGRLHYESLVNKKLLDRRRKYVCKYCLENVNVRISNVIVEERDNAEECMEVDEDLLEYSVDDE